MSTISNSAPAFPSPVETPCYLVLTQRAFFAGQAMQGYLAGRNNNNSSIDSHAANVAADCVRYADALIFALNQPTE